MVGLFFCRIFLNFPLKSLGGNGSRGELVRWPRTTPSSSSEWPVSLPAMTLTALSSKDMLDGRKPVGLSRVPLKDASDFSQISWILPFLLLFSSWQKIFFSLSAANSNGVKMPPNIPRFSLLMRFNLCTCQGSSATVTFMNWAGIGLLGQPLLFSAKKARRQRRERGKVMTKGGWERFREAALTAPTSTASSWGRPE